MKSVGDNACASTKAGLITRHPKDPVFARLAHCRVVDRPVVRIAGPEALLSIRNVYEQSHVARPIYGPAFWVARSLLAQIGASLLIAVRREVARIE